MKSNRMFGIVCFILDREKTTARELAEYFEVSVRTIHRDLLDLSSAGFPVSTQQGVGGGVSLLPRFRYDRSALTREEMKVVLAGIQGLASIDDRARIRTLLAKLRFNDGNALLLENDIIIDFTSWNPNQMRIDKIKRLRAAIADHRVVEIAYCGGSGCRLRKVEPYKLIFKQEHWYLFGFCALRQDFRVFKVDRIAELHIDDEEFREREDYEIPPLRNHFANEDGEHVTVRMDRSLEFLAVDFFGPDRLRIEGDDIFVSFRTQNPEWVIGTFASFGRKAEILSPGTLREEMKTFLEQAGKQYET